jgi:hypothetical protein
VISRHAWSLPDAARLAPVESGQRRMH